MTVIGDDVLVGTRDGIWRRSLSGYDDWRRSGLAGAELSFVEPHPTNPDRVFPGGLATDSLTVPFYYPGDAGQSWTAAANSVYDDNVGRYYDFFDMTASVENADLLYANMSADTVNVSVDGGVTWMLADGETEVNFGDYCHLVSPTPAEPRLFQGCEVPLDIASLSSYDVDMGAPFILGDPERLVRIDDLGNRRPNVLEPAAERPTLLLVGLEGALMAYDTETESFSFPYRVSATDAGDAYYTYIRGIWTHPQDADVILFGGAENGKTDDTLELYRTDDGGDTVELVEGPDDGLPSVPRIEQLSAGLDTIPPEQSVLVLVTDRDGALYLYRYVIPG